MFSMTSLQSQNSPLRTIDAFYIPKNRPNSRRKKKTYDNSVRKLQIDQLYNPSVKQLSAKKYIDGISKVKRLQRRPINRQEIYSFLSFSKQPVGCKKGQSYKEQKSFSSIKLPSTSFSRAQSQHSMLDNKQKFSFKNQWKDFKHKLQKKEQENRNRLMFTFYNNDQKSKHIMEKYRQDESLDQRKSNYYQNVFNRTIARESLLNTMRQIDRKRRKGEIV